MRWLGRILLAQFDAVLIFTGPVILRVPGAAGLGALVFLGACIPFARLMDHRMRTSRAVTRPGPRRVSVPHSGSGLAPH